MVTKTGKVLKCVGGLVVSFIILGAVNFLPVILKYTPDSQTILTKILNQNPPLSLEVYDSKSDFTQGDQSLAVDFSQPFLYKFPGFPNGFKLWLFKKGDVWVSGSIRSGEIWEPSLIRFILNRFKTLHKLRSQVDAHSNISIKETRPWGMLDIGAHIGTITVPAAQIISQYGLGSVTAVEAVPLHVLLIRKSIEQNHLDNILVIRNAISNISGINLKLKTDVHNRGGASAIQLEEVESAVSVTVDQIYEMYPQRMTNTLIWKMDIECYEGYAFSGATKFLEEVRPCYIMVELKRVCLNDNGPLKYREITSLLESLGYKFKPTRGEDHRFRHNDCCKEHESCIFK